MPVKKMAKKNFASRAKKGGQVKTFALAAFLNDFGSDMIYPVWPIFVTSVLGAPMSVLGLLDGLGDALVSISQAVSGYFSDKWRKRKPFIWFGYLCGSASRVGYGLSTVWWHLLPFRVLDRAGKMRDAPRDAMVADASSKANRGSNFGFLKAFDRLGAVFGIIACILVINWLGYRNLFLFAAIPSVIAAALVYFAIREDKPARGKIAKKFEFNVFDGNYKLFLASASLLALASFSYSFLLVFANQEGFQIALLPVFYLVFVIFQSGASIPAGRLADAFGRKPVLALSAALWAASCLSFLYLGGLVATFVSFALFGLHKGSLEPVQKTFVSELAEKRYRGTALGVFQMAVGLCALPASLAAGWLWDAVGSAAMFWLAIALTAASIALLAFVREKR